MSEHLDPGRRPAAEPPAPPITTSAADRARILGRRARRSVPFVGGVLATFLAIALYGVLNPSPRPLTTHDVDAAVASALASQTAPPARSQLVYAAIQPSLVFIKVTEPSGAPAPDAVGSGVVVNQAGTVLTALHVVEKSTGIQLTFADGSTSPAVIASSQPESDIAVLQPLLPPAGIVPATLGNPRSVQVGSEAYVVGNPFGLSSSLSTGVISGLDRSYQYDENGPVYRGLIQIDAAVNPGNSGGPLLDRNGQVVGIVTALVNPTKQDVFIGIGLAVPIDVAGGAAGLPPY